MMRARIWTLFFPTCLACSTAALDDAQEGGDGDSLSSPTGGHPASGGGDPLSTGGTGGGSVGDGLGTGGLGTGGSTNGGGATGGNDGSGGGDGTGGNGGTGGVPTSTEVLSVTIEEDSEGFCDFSGQVESEHSGFSGSGYANGAAGVGQQAEWLVSASGGMADLTFRYASAAARPATLSVNGSVIDTLPFSSTIEWTSWQEQAVTVELAPGDNSIILAALDENGLVNLDNLTATGMGVSEAACPEPEPPEPGVAGLIGFATENGGTTGGAAGQTVTATTYSELQSYAESATPYVIMVQGTITNGSGGGRINVASNKSLIGVGASAFLDGVGINIANSNNVIVQNLRATLVGLSNPSGTNGGDVISISGTSKNIWIDHCELFSENPNVQTNIDLYDGLIDIKNQTGFITISWNYLHDHHKGGLVGAADDDLYADRKVTLHHNFYENVKLRVPMYRGSTGHFFNNYVVGAQDATEIRAGTCVRVEKNYYEALHYSIYTPSDSPGSTERIDNIEVDRTSRAYPSNCTANIGYEYASVLTSSTQDVKTVVPAFAGVGQL